jgi:hypothetical protein
MLNIIALSYSGYHQSAPVTGTLAERRNDMFGRYVDQALRRRVAGRCYTNAQTLHWLRWLARQMATHGQTVFYLEALQLDWLPEKLQVLIRRVHALVFGIVFGSLGYVLVRNAFGLLGAIATGVGFGMLGARAGFRYLENPWRPGEGFTVAETVRWSWTRLRKFFEPYISGRRRFTRGEASLVMMFAFVLSIVFEGWLVGLIASMAMGGLVVLLIGGLEYGSIDAKASPNDGLRRSGANGLLVGLVASLLVVPVGWAIGGRAVGLGVGPLLGLAACLRGGGGACLRHFALRFWLSRNRSAPWGYVTFLDSTTSLLLLRKVGGGYMFIHRTLMNWFADRYVEPSGADSDSIALATTHSTS